MYVLQKPYFKEPKTEFISSVQKHFKFDISKRISLIADVNQFNYKEDESVFNQARNKAPNTIEVYWDGVWVCDFNDKQLRDRVELNFLKGFTKLYEEGRIFLNEGKEREIVESRKQMTVEDHLAEAKKMSEKTVEDKLSKQAIIEVLEEKKEKVDKIRKKLKNKNVI